ncbi:hypothetical protein [Nostoc sp.]|uniref:hypothetical protein n=1 Tax=Nostoc sp. TaxID=1180 RepID=UPI002FFB5F23
MKLRQIPFSSYFFPSVFLSLCPLRPLRFVPHIVRRTFIQNWYKILSGIKNAIVISHGPSGCAYGFKRA